MTLLIRRRGLLLLTLVTCAAVLIPAAVAYSQLIGAVDLSLSEAKLRAERTLFVGIICLASFSLTILLVVVRVYSLTNALARIADLHRISGHDVEPVLNRLGDVGEYISLMYGQLTELSTRKTTRIAAMNSLLNVLMARSNQKLLVAGPQGSVYRVSPPALKFLERTAGATLGELVDTVIPNVDFARVRAGVGRSGELWVAERTDYPVAVQPVFNDAGEVAYYVFYLEREARHATEVGANKDQPDVVPADEPPLPQPPVPKRQKRSVLSRLRRFLTPR